MNKFPLFLALCLAVSLSFAQKGKNETNSERYKRNVENSRGCHYKCVEGEMVLYKGKNKANRNGLKNNWEGDVQNIGEAFSVDCPAFIDEQTQTTSQLKKLNESCEKEYKEKYSHKKRR